MRDKETYVVEVLFVVQHLMQMLPEYFYLPEPAPTETRLEKLPGYSAESKTLVEFSAMPDGAAGQSSGKSDSATEACERANDRSAADKNSMHCSKPSSAAVLLDKGNKVDAENKLKSPEELKRKRTGEELVRKSIALDGEIFDGKFYTYK